MASLTPRPGILEIDPYVPGASKAKSGADAIKLSANESALGVSEKALAAYRAAAETLPLYPDGGASALREAIAEVHGLDAARIVCGAGSDELLQLLARAYAGPGDNVVQSAHGFLVYGLAAKSCGAEVRFAPEAQLTTDVDAMLAAVDEATRIVFVANPNNPTGTYISTDEMARLRDGLPDDVLLVIDAAYAEYVEAADYSSGVEFVDAHDNVVMTRTFSKIYGLGGLRIGWGYFPPEIADVIHRIRGPFNVSAAAIAAGAAAVRDQAFVARNRDHNRAERDFLVQQIGGLGLEMTKSVGNFVLVRFPDEPGRSASEVFDYLSENGVIVRAMGAYRLPSYLRISIGAKDANRRLVDLLHEKFAS